MFHCVGMTKPSWFPLCETVCGGCLPSLKSTENTFLVTLCATDSSWWNLPSLSFLSCCHAPKVPKYLSSARILPNKAVFSASVTSNVSLCWDNLSLHDSHCVRSLLKLGKFCCLSNDYNDYGLQDRMGWARFPIIGVTLVSLPEGTAACVSLLWESELHAGIQ